ncbi:hypothetical protein QTP88_020673 [Uroleucon formosanum]
MEQFYTELNALKSNIGKNNTLLSDKRYNELVKEVLMLRCLKTKKNPHDFWLQKRSLLYYTAVDCKRRLVYTALLSRTVLCYGKNLIDVVGNAHLCLCVYYNNACYDMSIAIITIHAFENNIM